MTGNTPNQRVQPGWIDAVEYEDADNELKQIYDKVMSPDGRLHNLYKAFSLRPHIIVPADDLYLAALHNVGNTLPGHFSELIGTYVAMRTGCDYAAAHHGHNYRHLAQNPERAAAVLEELARDNLEECGTVAEVGALRYARKLCDQPAAMDKKDIERLKESGWDDGEILEIVQVVAMFSYFVRVINGIGIQLGDERIGLY